METDEVMSSNDNAFFQSIKYKDILPVSEFHFITANNSAVVTKNISKFLTTKIWIIWGEYHNDYLVVTRININTSNTTYRTTRIIKC